MNALVSAVNELQTVLVDIGWEPVELPRIVLAGGRGCGKSSLLEALVGEPIIPESRSTRRPLIVQLVNFPQESDGDEAWVEFIHRPGKMFKNFDAVGREIDAETERTVGRNNGFSTVPVLMKFYSSKVMNFTLIDLPGLAPPREGDRSQDAENEIRNQVIKYLKQDNTVVLAVVAGDSDVRTSEIVRLAEQADPSGKRTLCVLTKLDLLNAGSDATDLLLGNIANFKMEIVATICRSQRDVDSGLTVEEVLEKEKRILDRNYKPIADRHGTPYLCVKIYKFLIKRIKLVLPEIREKIQEDLEGFGANHGPFDKHSIDSQESLLCFLTKYVAAYADSVSGTCKNVGTYELEGGARIGYIFREVFGKALDRLNPMEGYDRPALLTALRNSSGTKPSLFVPQHCFEQLVKRQIIRLVEPSVCCVTLVQEELLRMSCDCDRELSRQMELLPLFRAKVYTTVTKLVKSRMSATVEMVENFIGMHTAYINTAHPDFLLETYKYRSLFEDQSGTKPPDSDSDSTYVDETRDDPDSFPNECILIESMVTSYFNIIRKSVADAVPKIIMHFMVNHVSDHLLTELVASIYSEGDPTDLLQEAPLVAAQRESIRSTVESLNNALCVINYFMKL